MIRDLRQIQRDFRAFLVKNKNKTGQQVRDGKDFYERQAQKAAQKLNAFESKHDLDKYKMKPSKTLKLPKGGSGGGAMIDLTRRTGKSLLQSEFRKKL